MYFFIIYLASFHSTIAFRHPVHMFSFDMILKSALMKQIESFAYFIFAVAKMCVKVAQRRMQNAKGILILV